jgi:succinate---hydroxymethylglutarate CoA-transferase
VIAEENEKGYRLREQQDSTHDELLQIRPLLTMRVVEFSHVAAGPFTGMLLADLGADVVKIESPEGDQMRSWPPIDRSPIGGVFSHNFASVNRNKRGAVLDLKQHADQRTARRLVSAADVVVENYRPGMLARYGLDFESVSEGHGGLVYCSISGYGPVGPHAGQGAYDVIIQAASGLMSVTGEADGPPVKSGVPVADFVTALYAAYTIAALFPISKQTGRSFHVDCAMLDCLLGVSALQASEYWGSGREPSRMGSKHPRNAPYQVFAAADRDFVIAAGSDRLWRATCDVVGKLELAVDPRFLDQGARALNQGALEQMLAPVFVTRSAADWLTQLTARGVPCGLVNTFGDVLSSEHAQSTQLVEVVESALTGPLRMVAYPPLINSHRLRSRHGPPGLGEHTQAVTVEWAERARATSGYVISDAQRLRETAKFTKGSSNDDSARA